MFHQGTLLPNYASGGQSFGKFVLAAETISFEAILTPISSLGTNQTKLADEGASFMSASHSARSQPVSFKQPHPSTSTEQTALQDGVGCSSSPQ